MDSNLRKKTIITAALVGAATTKAQNPTVPYTIDEYAQEAAKCFKSGASIVHVHARTDEGVRTQDPNRYDAIVSAIKKSTPELIINITGGTGATEEERTSPLKRVLPEMCSIDVQTMNWGMINPKDKKLLVEYDYINSFQFMITIGEVARQLKIKPEIEVFSESGIYNILYLQKAYQLLEEPMHIQYVFGVLGGIPYNLENLAHLRAITPKNATWAVCGVAKDQFKCNMAAITDGGHLRVGLEDNVRLPNGELAKGNYELVEWAKKLIHLSGRELATPEETRKILHLRD